MKIHHLKPAPGATKTKTRKGRGESAGKGKTAGRGTKGTGARKNTPAGFEGGQMPLQRRLPKLPGFAQKGYAKVEFQTVNVSRLDEAFEDGAQISPDALRAQGLVRRGSAPVKVLGNGDLGKRLTVSAHAFSASARDKIEAGGGQVQVLPQRPPPIGEQAGRQGARLRALGRV